MERFYSKAPKKAPSPSTTNESLPTIENVVPNSKEPLLNPDDDGNGQGCAKRTCIELDLTKLPSDPASRKSIMLYDVNVRDKVRRAYLQRGPCQPRGHEFKQTAISTDFRRFQVAWFDDFPLWLEYSTSKEAVFCLFCYLFKSDAKQHSGTCDAFVVDGFTNWKNKSKLYKHVGKSNSEHNKAWRACQALMNEKQHIDSMWKKKTKEDEDDYKARLTRCLGIVRLLLRQRLPFRGHDESEDSNNQGNYLEFLKFYNEEIAKVCPTKIPGNLKLTSSDIQKGLVRACAIETTKKIMEEVGDSLFSILIDEARDISTKEQMAIVFRYVDKFGHVIERYMGIIHVKSTTSLSLKNGIDDFFSKHNLSMSNLRGQGYDGASNMRGEFNGLKALILKENSCAYSVERVFSAMNLVKTYLRNRMGDEWMANCLMTYVEKDIFNSIDDEVILQCYQTLGNRRKYV